MKLTTPHVYGWVRVANDVQSSRAHGHNREVLDYLERRPGKRQELLLDTADKPLTALYILALGCLDG
jgi:hypothetical protein